MSTTDQTQEGLAEEIAEEPSVTHKRKALPPEMEQQIELQRQQNVLAATIAGLSWGRQMHPAVRRAFAAYCAKYDVDPITEMDNLGGQPYVNADWYKRKLGELIVRGIVRDYTLEHVQADPRLRKIFDDPAVPQEMRDEARRRWFHNAMKRVEHNAPEEAEAICVCTIHLPNGTKAIGCKWGGGGTSVMQPRHGGGAAPNPIVESNPTLSVESQSIRRALSQLLSHVSGQRISAMEFPVLEEMNAELRDLQTEVKDTPRPAPAPDPGFKAIAAGGYGEDAAELAERIRQSHEQRDRELVTTPQAARERGLKVLSSIEDPYGLEPADRASDESVDAGDSPKVPTPAPVSDIPPRVSGVFADGREVTRGPEPSAPATDLFGSETAVEPTGLDAIECEECGRMIRKGHPEDHGLKCIGHPANQ